jgi:hypothetical protein
MRTGQIDWNHFIDAYCERSSAAFWAEPVNALTNAAFLLAAALLWRELRRSAVRPLSLHLLLAVLVAIGVGSFLFHTVATRWAALADVLPIYLFMHGYAACFLRWAIGWRWRWAWLGAPAFFVLAQLMARLVPAETVGMGGYVPALTALLGFAVWLRLRRDHLWRWFAGAALVFALSLTLRQLDMPLCDRFSLGTHFAWHVANALTLYLVTHALLQAAQRVRDATQPGPNHATPA